MCALMEWRDDWPVEDNYAAEMAVSKHHPGSFGLCFWSESGEKGSVRL